jgi:hypothetical protein
LEWLWCQNNYFPDKSAIIGLDESKLESFGFYPQRTPAPNLGTASDWARAGINEAYEKGFVPAAIQGSYTADIKRGEFVSLMMQWLRYHTWMTNDQLVKVYGQNPNWSFEDTQDSDALTAMRLGILSGVRAPTDDRPGVFGTDVLFDREAAAIMLIRVCRILGGFNEDESDFGFTDIEDARFLPEAINYAAHNEIMRGSGNPPRFNPLGGFSREMSIVTFNNLDKMTVAAAVFSDEGGAVQVNGTKVYTFTPDRTGLWRFETSDNGSSDPHLIIYDIYWDVLAIDDDGGEGLNAMIEIYLAAGVTYIIHAGFFADGTGSYTLTATPIPVAEAVELPDEGGAVRVNGTRMVVFTPDRTGLWWLETSDNGDSDPYLILYGTDGYIIAIDDDGGEELNALIEIHLTAGVTYIIHAGFYADGTGSYTLTATPPAP